MKLADLVDAVPADVEERVDKTRQRFNGLVRAILREEMALRLSMPSIDSDRSAKLETTTVPVRLKAGVPLVDNSPVEVKNVEVIDIVLGCHRSGLEALASGAAASSRLVDVLEASGVAAPGSYPSHEHQICERWARTFLERLKEADPLTHILDFREDILGRYLYRLPQFIQPLNQWTKDPYRGEVELYWGVIGLVAELLGSTPEDLAVVILSHELAHAYTHIGADIDGSRWGSMDFKNSAVELKEGLAQYYTQRVCIRLQDRCPGALRAFEELLPRQPERYWTHVRWIETKSSPEHVRTAMLETRRRGSGNATTFEETLAQARARLGH